MRIANVAMGLLGLAAAAACGGRTAALVGDGLVAPADDASSPDDATSPGGSSGGAPAGSSASSSGPGYGSSGSSPGGSSSGYVMPPPPGGSSSGAACSPNAINYGLMSTIEPCWSCILGGCKAQLVACTEDCTCNSAVVQALECVNGGGPPISCFMPALTNGGSDPALSGLKSCLLTTAPECNCTPASSSSSGGEDAATACTPSGTSASAGGGQCTATLTETCSGAVYQAVCSCPRGSCVCFGNTTTIVDYPDCPYCPAGGPGVPGLSQAEVFAACGFPQ